MYDGLDYADRWVLCANFQDFLETVERSMEIVDFMDKFGQVTSRHPKKRAGRLYLRPHPLW